MAKRESVSEDTVNKIRKLFGTQVAARIEEWTLDTQYPESTLQCLLMENLPKHIEQMIDVLSPLDLTKQERELAAAQITVTAHEFIASEIDRMSRELDS